MLNSCTDHTRSSFGTHSHTLARLEVFLSTFFKHAFKQGAREYAEHFLTHDIGGLTNTVYERINLFKCRRFYHVEAVSSKEITRYITHALPCTHVIAKQIFSSLHPLRHLCNPFSPAYSTRKH